MGFFLNILGTFTSHGHGLLFNPFNCHYAFMLFDPFLSQVLSSLVMVVDSFYVLHNIYIFCHNLKWLCSFVYKLGNKEVLQPNASSSDDKKQIEINHWTNILIFPGAVPNRFRVFLNPIRNSVQPICWTGTETETVWDWWWTTKVLIQFGTISGKISRWIHWMKTGNDEQNPSWLLNPMTLLAPFRSSVNGLVPADQQSSIEPFSTYRGQTTSFSTMMLAPLCRSPTDDLNGAS